jgi:aminoglycoside phosphotransferase (APT) family kinase protein
MADADIFDQPAPVRAGQGFDVEALAAWLRPRIEGLEATPELLQFGRGYSNLTYLVRFGARELVVRRAPPGVTIKSAHDMGREHRILSALARVHDAWPKAPRPLASCSDASVIGTAFYVMERVRGVILRAKTPAGLVLDAPAMRRASEATCETLAEIHGIDWRAIGLGDLGKPRGYVERQVRGWTDRYAKARTDDVPQVEKLASWLEARRPPESGATLVHNDFKYDNVVLTTDVGRVEAVLDWEMATIGDPLMDLGTALGYWIQADDPPVFQVTVFGPTNRPGNLTRVEFAERWSRATGRDASDVLFYYAFALFKLAVVAQQLYRRWVDGNTKEERYAMMLEGVKAVASSALVAIEKGRIDRLVDDDQ